MVRDSLKMGKKSSSKYIVAVFSDHISNNSLRILDRWRDRNANIVIEQYILLYTYLSVLKYVYISDVKSMVIQGKGERNQDYFAFMKDAIPMKWY